MLSQDDISAFLAGGYAAVRDAVPATVAAACQEIIWSGLRQRGVLRVNAGSRARGLLALYLLTDVETDGAPTRLRRGSHLDVPRILAPAGDDGMDWSQAAQQAARASAHRPTVLATGRAGDVFLCHPFLVHAASWPHRGRFPRMIAQPAVALHGQYPPQALPGAPSPPVQQAILDGLRPACRTGAVDRFEGLAEFLRGRGRLG